MKRATALVGVFSTLLVAVLLPRETDAIFGISLTNGAGTVLAATNPTQTAALAGAALLTKAAGVGLGALLANQGRSSSGSSRSYRRTYYRRGRRSIQDEYQMEDITPAEIETQALAEMLESDPTDCYRMLICDISTGQLGQDEMSATSPILNLVEDESPIQPQLGKFRNDLKIAQKVGEKVKDLDFCESTFLCPVSGKTLADTIIGIVQQSA